MRRPTFSHPKIETVWDGPLYFDSPRSPGIPYVVLMFVTDLAGKVTFGNPQDIGAGETDWYLYREASRVSMDAVGGGAGTFRGSNITFSLFDQELVQHRMDDWKKPRHPIQVVFTKSGRLDREELIFQAPDMTSVVLTTSDGEREAKATLGDLPNVHLLPTGETMDPSYGLQALRSDHGVERLLVVGGAEVATDLLQRRLVDELFLVRSGRLLGGASRRTFFEGQGFPPHLTHDWTLTTVKIGVRDENTLLRQYLKKAL
jgi:riboflavin biosynthesis pyrimidine reductase